jgi:hypothetical protein
VTAQRSGGEGHMDFDARVRALRPEPSDELLDRLVGRPRARRATFARPVRLAAAATAVAALGGALGVTGALGYASSAVQQDLSQVKQTMLAGPQTVLSSPADGQYRPGKGCGDKNHIHDSRFECKVAINDVSVREGNSASRSAVFTVSLDSSAIDPVTVEFSTIDGTASAPSDYDSAAGTLTFNVGESTKTITVLLRGDTGVEANETYSVTLSSPSPNALLTDGQGTGSIRNDD